MKPTIGRIVHYTNLGDADGKYPPEQQAAIITKVQPVDGTRSGFPSEEDQWNVWLHVFYPTGDFFLEKVPYSQQYERGKWSWPPRA